MKTPNNKKPTTQQLERLLQQQAAKITQLEKEQAIEAALDKVRARTMAMHKTDELRKVVSVLFEQMNHLHLADEGCNINIFKEDINSIETWMAGLNNATFPDCYYMEGQGHPFLQKQWDNWRAQAAPFHISSVGEELAVYAKYLLEETDLKRIPAEIKEMMLSIPELHFSFITFKYGQLEIVNTVEPPSQENLLVLTRFAKVFEQTYTRFLDLQKAEAQAREAQIEAALERVRAATMAMYKSDELRTVNAVVFQQLVALGFDIPLCGFIIYDRKNGDSTHLLSGYGTDLFPDIYHAPYFDHPYLNAQQDAWKEGATFKSFVWEGALKKSVDDYYFQQTDLKILPPEVKDEMQRVKRIIISDAFMSHGLLEVNSLIPISSEQQNILVRFAKVFDQTYTRFLDIQKAETQAREAQIETALERVRAASMAMHKSADLKNVVSVLYKEIQPFGLATSVCTIHVFHEETQKTEVWAADGKDANHLESYFWYSREHPIIDLMWKEWEQKKESLDIHLEGDQKKDLDEYFLTKTDYKNYPKELRKEIRSSKEVYFSCVYFQKGFIASSDFQSPSQDQKDILFRFVRVFDRTYSRFLDLQRAEAQAKEAQIEAALERVRAATMAMHHSGELSDAVKVLFAQFQNLKIDTIANWIGLIDVEANTMEIWSTSGGKSRPAYTVNGTEYHNFQADIDAFKNKQEYRQHSMERESAIQVLQEQFEFEIDLPEEATHYHLLQMRHEFGFLGYGSWQEADAEVFPILKRFCAVFEQTYTRFLDLQKAEERAKEAKIEAAMERVRSAAMAMDKSAELKQVVGVIFDELKGQGFPTYLCSIGIYDAVTKGANWWSSMEGDRELPDSYHMPYLNGRWFKETYETWKKQKPFHFIELVGEEQEEHTRMCFEETGIKDFSEATKTALREADKNGIRASYVSMTHGLIEIVTDEPIQESQIKLLQRFAKVIDLTYTRVADLQQAEKQAQELEVIFQENQRLLHSILPEQIAEQIRAGQQTIVKRFEQVSILFADIVGFTILSEKITPQEVVDILNGLFSKFDDLTDKYGLEKIKTIGDAYMVASGVPEEKANHAHVLFQFAQDMLQAIQDFNQAIGTDLKIRIGISSGPVVAGVIGKKKFAYDLWGDSVNTAARMEANGQQDCIQISPTTFAILKEDFVFEQIPNVEIKGKGKMDVYLWPPFTG